MVWILLFISHFCSSFVCKIYDCVGNNVWNNSFLYAWEPLWTDSIPTSVSDRIYVVLWHDRLDILDTSFVIYCCPYISLQESGSPVWATFRLQKKWQLTPDTWHLVPKPNTWHLTCDTQGTAHWSFCGFALGLPYMLKQLLGSSLMEI